MSEYCVVRRQDALPKRDLFCELVLDIGTKMKI